MKMISKFMKWCDTSIMNSAIGWTVLLFLLYWVAYPIYYILAVSSILMFIFAGPVVFELKELKEIAFKNSSIGFVIALPISLYVGINYLGPYGLWEYLVSWLK